jgi:hypothetical protein
MKEGPQYSPRRFQFTLWTFLAIVAALGVGFEMGREHRGEITWCIAVPFAVGLAVGDIAPPRSKGNVDLMILTPVVSGFVVCMAIFLVGIFYRYAYPDANPNPIILQALADVFFVWMGVFVFGAIPSLAGLVIWWSPISNAIEA